MTFLDELVVKPYLCSYILFRQIRRKVIVSCVPESDMNNVLKEFGNAQTEETSATSNVNSNHIAAAQSSSPIDSGKGMHH